MHRRNFLKAVLAGAATPVLAACAASQQTASTTGPSVASALEPLRLGILAVTDMAPLAVAERKGFYQKYDLNRVEIIKETSWTSIRDKLLNGELHAAQFLVGIPFFVYTSDLAAARTIPIALILSANGQSLTLSNKLQVGYGQVDRVKAAIEQIRAAHSARPPAFSIALPGVINDLLLRSWLAVAQVDAASVQIPTVPPPQTVAKMKLNEIDGFFVAEPWPELAIREGVGYTHLTSQDMWQDGPDKCLAVNATFAAERRDELKRLMMALLEAQQWLDVPANRSEAIAIISEPGYANVAPDLIAARFQVAPEYRMGADQPSKTYQAGQGLAFYKDGQIPFPRHSHAIWYMAQYVRFGLINQVPDYQAVADKLVLQDLYHEVAKDMQIALPNDDMQPFALQLDQILFDPNDVAASLQRYGAVA